MKHTATRTRSMVYCALFTALIAVGAFIRVPVPVVPFTLQYLFTMLAGLLLGSKRGAVSVAVYVLLGLAGLPIFTEGGGLGYIFKPSFGYLAGFCVGAYLTGYLAEQLHRLHQAGVTNYHHNIETSRRNFPNICTTHSYDMKIETLKKVKAEGMRACSGGIIGMGETWADRLDMAVSLAELGIDSIPLNTLMPIPGTPLEHLPRLTEADILRTIALFRYINPCADIRLAAGRALLTNDGETAFQSGASATITGNMLTTAACATIRSDRKMLQQLGRDIGPEDSTETKA